MPRTADHDQRRAQIADGLVRVVARSGLYAVKMRDVAAEAGVSLRLVQYYFETKEQLIRGALKHLERQSNQRWADRIARLPDPHTARDYVEAFLAEALPSDERSRIFHVVGTSYAALAMTDPEIAEQPLVVGLEHLERQLAARLRTAQADGELPMDRNPGHEAAKLVALNHGLGTTILVGQRTVRQAKAILRGHLDQLFSPRR